MRATVLRILLNGLIAAAVLAAIGYLMADMAGAWSVAGPTVIKRDAEEQAQAVSRSFRVLPLTMAGWGFVVVAGLELLRAAFRGRKQAPPAPPTGPTVEEQLNKLLAEADAAKKPDAPPGERGA